MGILPYKIEVHSLIILVFIVMIDSFVVFDFNTNSNLANWTVLDDVVMGGRSSSSISINTEGHGVFKGHVSLENNGGFASVRYQTKTINVNEFTTCMIRLKGDGKNYQFRIKAKNQDRHSYIARFNTTGKWQTLEIDMSEMTPWFRGRRLDMDNYQGITIESISFLIGNKKEEDFKLEIDKIALQ